MVAATASRTAVVRRRVTAREGARIAVSPVWSVAFGTEASSYRYDERGWAKSTMLTEPSRRLTSSSLAPVPFGPGACGPTVRGDVMRPVRGIITSLLAVLWTAPLCAQQPTGTIRGHVTDAANQQPLSGVTVAVGSRAALTQADGRYLITGVPVGTDSLRTRMIGYARATRPVTVVGGETVVVDLALTAQAVHLSEIVVTGYGAQRAGNMTGSAAKVNASNGVVLITTKSGQGRPRVEYSGSVSAASVTRLPSMLNAAQFRTAVQTNFPKNDSLLLNANTNWFDLVDRTAMGQQHDVALSGAGSNNSYRLSLGYSNQDGILKGTTAQRISLGVGYDQQLYDGRLDLRANLKGSRTLDQFTPGGVLYNAAQMGPTQPVYDSTSATGYANWAAGNPLTSADNPVEVLNLAKDHGTTYRSVGNVQAKYDFSSFQPLRGLTGTVNLGYDITDVNRVTFYPNNIHLETKNGTDGSYYRTAPSQTNTVLETYLDYRPPANLGPGNLGLTGGYS